MNINATGSVEQFLKLTEMARTRNAGFRTPIAAPSRPARPAPAAPRGFGGGPRAAYGIRPHPALAEHEAGSRGGAVLGTRFDAYA